MPAEQLWKGVISVSNAGKKRGRGKGAGKKMAKDLNRGQQIGVGKDNILWPGLNAPIVRGKELVKLQRLPEDPEREAKLHKIRDSMGNFKFFKLSPLERGWSGTKMPGRSIGPPDPVAGDTFDGFDTKVLEMKTVVVMTGNLGRTRRQSVFAVTGNGNGLAGFALGKALEGRAALRKAKNRAGQKLIHIPLCDGHTVNHDFFCQFGITKIYVTKKPEGYGLKCHRVIKIICEVLGIRDLHAKVEGAMNVQHITKAFFLGLLQQKTHQQLAEEKQLHVVEFRNENGNFPRILASPQQCRKPHEIKSDEILDFTQYVLNDRIIYRKKKNPPFYAKYKSYENYLLRMEHRRNHDKIRMNMLINHGELKSFLTDKYPECKPGGLKKEENVE